MERNEYIKDHIVKYEQYFYNKLRQMFEQHITKV
jgi:hypothetical protein